MTDFAIIALVIGFVAVSLVCVLSMYVSQRNAGRLINSMATQANRQQLDANSLVETVLEKLMVDPQWAAQLHQQQRMIRANLQTSLEREAIRLDKSQPAAADRPPGWNPEGVDTEDINLARG